MFQPLAESVHYIHILYTEQGDKLEKFEGGENLGK